MNKASVVLGKLVFDLAIECPLCNSETTDDGDSHGSNVCYSSNSAGAKDATLPLHGNVPKSSLCSIGSSTGSWFNLVDQTIDSFASPLD